MPAMVGYLNHWATAAQFLFEALVYGKQSDSAVVRLQRSPPNSTIDSLVVASTIFHSMRARTYLLYELNAFTIKEMLK
ncbi:hypothetical protein TNCV_4098971 [Trichonephila clavipes]|nr:hypothetical protein TNCV_4098971 [Trichonephila clavipes]